ncbi:MAG: glycerophosphodiester phosphodiesterase [Betaproteobacteria bacterium]|nr:glycerophosphodiester phosphodiesterase [Betaproteobacteria bacterium]MDH3435435.1 glycerophosphodiester phosphodiesterase [Betaproteobacteria bacterium]
MAATGTYALDLQGHRGARGLAPENTLAAFARALSIGVTTLEMDCAVTKDGVAVIGHDSVLNPDLTRGPDGNWLTNPGPRIRDLTYEELQRYDVGRINPASAYAKRWPEQQAVDGARIPRLSDVFNLVRKAANDTVRFNIETKTSPLAPDETVAPEVFARVLISAVRAAGMADRTAIQSFDWRTLAVVQADAPEIATVYLTTVSDFMDNIQASRPSSPWTAGLHVSQFEGAIPRMVKAAGGAVWSPYSGDLTREAVKEAHAFGLKVVVWTVNEPADMRRLIDWGVDGIISDRPDVLRRVAGEKGAVLPPPTPVAP